MYNTGSPRADAEADFLRARRQQVLGSIAGRFRGDADQAALLSFEETVRALGFRGETREGLLVIPLERVVGSVDKVTTFDRSFRPTTGRARDRWERLDQAFRRGEEVPPIEVYKLGDMYFVRDGHHRVSVARALGLDLIEADVTEIRTAISPQGVSGRDDLDKRHWRRIFLERVPLTGRARAELDVTDPHSYHRLAEMVEAWSARQMHVDQAYLDRATAAARWHAEEYLPVLAMIDDAGLPRSGETPTDSYLRVACERYKLTREHTWDMDVMDELARRDRK